MANFEKFVEVFEDPDPYFIEDNFEQLGITSVVSNFSVGSCEQHPHSYSRSITGLITFDVNSIEELKEFLEDEGVLEENDVDSSQFVLYFVGDIDSINFDEDENGDFISIDIQKTNADGEIKFQS